MEGTKHRGFFFVAANQKIDAANRFIKSRFGGLFEDRESNDKGTFGKHFYDIIREKQEERIIQISRIASARGMTRDEVKKLTVYEYFLFCEDIMAEKQTQANE